MPWGPGAFLLQAVGRCSQEEDGTRPERTYVGSSACAGRCGLGYGMQSDSSACHAQRRSWLSVLRVSVVKKRRNHGGTEGTERPRRGHGNGIAWLSRRGGPSYQLSARGSRPPGRSRSTPRHPCTQAGLIRSCTLALALVLGQPDGSHSVDAQRREQTVLGQYPHWPRTGA